MVEETDRLRLSLRRYTEPGCHGPGTWGYHNAISPLGDAKVIWEPTLDGGRALALRPERLTIPEDDPRWPQKCQWCEHRFAGFPFYPQVGQEIYYRGPGGDERLLRDWDPGASWFVDWMGPVWVGPDGRTLMVKLPDRVDWAVDGPAGNAPDTSKPGWTRTGVPPKVTARPSILTSKYHGFLTDGFLVEC